MDKIRAQSMQPIKSSQLKSVYANTNILGKLQYFTNLFFIRPRMGMISRNNSPRGSPVDAEHITIGPSGGFIRSSWQVFLDSKEVYELYETNSTLW